MIVFEIVLYLGGGGGGGGLGRQFFFLVLGWGGGGVCGRKLFFLVLVCRTPFGSRGVSGKHVQDGERT